MVQEHRKSEDTIGADVTPTALLHPEFTMVKRTNVRKHRGSTNTNPSVSTAFLGTESHLDGPKSSVSSFDSRSGIAPSFISTAPSEASNNHDGGDEPPSLQYKIRKATKRCIEWTTRSSEDTFLPDDETQSLICAATIREELAEHGYMDDIDSHIVPDRRKLFAILTLIGKGHFIIKLVEEGIDDHHLPFAVGPCRGYQPYMVREDTGADETNGIQAFTPPFEKGSRWKSHDSDSFVRNQWKLLAPHFDMLCAYHDDSSNAGGPPHYRFRPQEILPFTKPNEEWEPVEQPGGFSVVKKVHIHPAHRNHCRVDRCRLASLKANHAVKSIHQNCSPSDIQREINNLKRFDGKKHRDRLVQLLCTFEYASQYHLVFPWADGGNLADLWQNHLPDIHNQPRSYDLAKWIARESMGISQGLHLIHHPGPSSTTDERTEGRHGDIKPENILWFRNDNTDTDNTDTDNTTNNNNNRGTLKISDFGLTDYHRKTSVSRVRADSIGQTQTYRPPECEIPGGCVSPSYDTWSLGCVLLQFVTWYVEGWDGVDQFSKRRAEASPPRRVRDEDVAGDLFYALAKPPMENSAVRKVSGCSFLPGLARWWTGSWSVNHG
ncbi:kinase-like domain-containing protein [Chaetomium tenue]|uniref:Kinase-like domain-containing protein n=1 Tax=Chaetomium tenue TaxID=1854479 RepID=A0ACB7PFH2_9PEZI|nr:kinase-like domain-containing protein [Chaetomium globosum]